MELRNAVARPGSAAPSDEALAHVGCSNPDCQYSTCKAARAARFRKARVLADETASRSTQVGLDKLIEARGFEAAMRDVHALRLARSESHWKLFRLALCQVAIKELRNGK